MIAVTLGLFAGCGDDLRAGNVPGDDAAVADAVVDGATTSLTSCLDRPDDLPRPPTGALPCDLVPPTFGASFGPRTARAEHARRSLGLGPAVVLEGTR